MRLTGKKKQRLPKVLPKKIERLSTFFLENQIYCPFRFHDKKKICNNTNLNLFFMTPFSVCANYFQEKCQIISFNGQNMSN